jgi:hypothetical protein
MISFWTNDPTILFNKDYIFELWPTSSMCYEQKLNAISRLIILISLLGYILTFSIRILIAGFVTLLIIFLFFQMKKQKITRQVLEEGFTVEGDKVYNLYEKKNNSSRVIMNPVTLETAVSEEFLEGNKKNPFSNVLLTQIMDDPERKAAPPSFNPYIEEDITKNIKKSVQYLNPGIKNTNKQLYGDLYERFELDNANRPFFSTANTRIANDQGAFGKYLYGNMPSAKESTPEGNLQRIKDNYRYILY